MTALMETLVSRTARTLLAVDRDEFRVHDRLSRFRRHARGPVALHLPDRGMPEFLQGRGRGRFFPPSPRDRLHPSPPPPSYPLTARRRKWGGARPRHEGWLLAGEWP